MLSWQTYLATNYFASGNNPVPLGNAHPNICPYQAFLAQDGYFNIAIGNDNLWRLFCEGMDEPEWLTDDRFKTNPARVCNRDILIPLLEARFQEKPLNHWVALFRGLKIPCGPINQISDIFEDPYVVERNMLFTVNHPTIGPIKQVGTPVKYLQSSGATRIMTAPPLLNQHREEILHEFGFSVKEIKQLRPYLSKREVNLV